MSGQQPRDSFHPFIELAGRILIAVIFLVSGIGKIAAYTVTAGYMASQVVPGFLLPIVILTEIGGSLCIILGFNTRIVIFLMAGFTMLTALVFHNNFADRVGSRINGVRHDQQKRYDSSCC